MKKSSLYIHIPFCSKKCGYCDFFSVPRPSVPDEYVSALCAEIGFYARTFDLQFTTVYAGGGTPGLLSPSQIRQLFSAVNPFSCSEETTFEMNPESVTEEKLLVLKDCGVNRLSLGIQSLNQTALDECGRRCSALTARKALETVYSVWEGRLSLDAIAGLPGQSEKEFLASLREIAGGGCSHVSLYSLMLEEGTALYERYKSEEYDYDEADRQWIKGRDLLESLGFRQYEVSNFARPGFESRHNMSYWKQGDYCGTGSGATGTFYDEKLRWTNTQDLEKYISFWNDGKTHFVPELPRTEEILTEGELEEEFLMTGFRMAEGVTGREYERRFGKNLEERLGKSNVWKQFLEQGKAVHDRMGDRFYLLPEGLLLLNVLLCDL